MSKKEQRATKALIRAFLDQLQAHFGQDSQFVRPNQLFAIASHRLVPISCGLYSEPQIDNPERPAIARIRVGMATLPSAHELRRLGERIERTTQFSSRLELSLLPRELPSAAAWLLEWITQQVNRNYRAPPPPFRLASPSAPTDDFAWSPDYIWTVDAWQAYCTWAEKAEAESADRTQFAVRVFDTR